MNASAGSRTVGGGPCSVPVRRVTGLNGSLPALVVCGGLLVGAGPGAAQDTTATRAEPAATFQASRADARVGPGYSLDSVDPEGDTAEVLRLLRRRGLAMPHQMLRVRMVAVDETERRELLLLYVEALSTLDLSIDGLERSPELLDDVTAAAIARAAAGIRTR